MNRLSCLLCLLALSASVNAQKPREVASPKPTTSKTTEQREAEALQEIRRQAAIGALNSLADEARSYRDETLRARVQARIADAIWERDAARARGLFRRAWEAAEAVEGQPPSNEVTSVLGRVNRRPTGRPQMILRSEILRLAAKRDHALGEEFLAKLTPPKEETQRSSDPAGASAAPSLSPAAITQRLSLATEFLEAGEVERALQFADPALAQVVNPAISFLVALREKNALAADQRFASLLSRAAVDPLADANTVSLLTSYAFTPSMYVVVSNTGIPSTRIFEPRPAPDLAPALRTAYFRVASGILLQPAARLDQTAAGRAGTYYIGTRLFPLFQLHAPDLAPLISAQLTALRGDAQQAINAGERSLNQGVVPDDPAGDRVQGELEDRLSRARNADERDRAYAFAAMRAADTGDLRARDFTQKIEDSDTRNGVGRFVDYNLIRGLLRKKDVAEALRLAAKSDLTPAHRTGILTSAAGIQSTTDRARALVLLDESLAEARRIDAGTPERAYALVGLLAQFAKLEPTRMWQLVDETVKAANSVPGFTGEDGQIQFQLEGKFSIRMGVSLASSSDLADAFGTLAADDLFHAISVAGDFSGAAPRALATIAAARAILVEKLVVKNDKPARLPR